MIGMELWILRYNILYLDTLYIYIQTMLGIQSIISLFGHFKFTFPYYFNILLDNFVMPLFSSCYTTFIFFIYKEAR